jgi:ABC-2 type transport system ATP-binding protein
MTSAALAFRQVTKRFGSKIALAALTLEVMPGESFALVGMNGAGKTTLLKCLLDFCEPDAGDISIFDVPHRETRSRARLSFLPERFTPPYYLTGGDFLRYMLELQRIAYREEDARTTLDALDLDRAALDLPVRAYSKGMTQKLGLAACLLSRKDLYVLDEPTSGLDPKARALLKIRLKALRESGKTVFFTSHSLADVEEIGDRLAVLHLGEIRFVGEPAALKTRHHTASLEEAYLRCIDAEALSSRRECASL